MSTNDLADEAGLWALTGTAVAVPPGARRLDNAPTTRTRLGDAPGDGHVASDAMLVAGLMLLVQRWRARSGPLRRAMAGILLGLAAATRMTASCGTSCWA
jgi:hypothetical protein